LFGVVPPQFVCLTGVYLWVCFNSILQLQIKLLVSTCLQNVMVLVLQRAFNLHTFFPPTCTSASGIMPILGNEGLIMNPVFNFHVPVPQLRLCDVGDPCCILLFSLPLNGLRAIACLSQ